MTSILGLSHLIVTSTNRDIGLNNRLTDLFLLKEKHIFHDSIDKQGLLRSTARHTDLSIFTSKNDTLPALEILYSDSSVHRSLDSYGLLFPSKHLHKSTVELQYKKNIRVSSIIPIEETYFVPHLPILVSYSPLVAQHNCTMGAWSYTVNIELAKSFFSKILDAKIIDHGDGYAVFTTNVVNRKLTRFLWVLIEQNQPNSVCFYNDDVGFSCVGWLAKRLDIQESCSGEIGYQATKPFSINMSNNSFDATFFHNCDYLSHEIMVLK